LVTTSFAADDSAPRIHLRQRAHGGESHIDYALDTFSKRFVGAGDSLKGKKNRKRMPAISKMTPINFNEPIQVAPDEFPLPLNPMTEEGK
jgi:hypothetical protein